MKIKVPFRLGTFQYERDIDFMFRIATLESASLDVLKCELHELENQDAEKVNIAVLYSAYCLSCEKRGKRKIWSLQDAAFWSEHMSKGSQAAFMLAIQDLLGKMNKVGEKKK